MVDSPELIFSGELSERGNHAETKSGEGLFEDNSEKWEDFGLRRKEEMREEVDEVRGVAKVSQGQRVHTQSLPVRVVSQGDFPQRLLLAQ